MEVIAAHAVPPTWHRRLVSALSAAMPISSAETEGWHPTHRHMQTPHSITQSHHCSALKSARWWHRTRALVTVYVASQHKEHNSVFSPGAEGTDVRRRGSQKVKEMYCAHCCTTQMPRLSISCAVVEDGAFCSHPLHASSVKVWEHNHGKRRERFP